MKALDKIKGRLPEMSALGQEETGHEGGPVPSTLKTRFRKILLIAVSTFAVGLVIGIMSFPAHGWWAMPLLLVFMAAVMFLIAAVFWKQITRRGFLEIRGSVTYIKENALSVGKRGRAVAYHLRTDDGTIYQIPVYKSSPDAPLHAQIVVYAPKGVVTREQDGITHIGTIWGYALCDEVHVETDTQRTGQ